MPGDMCVQSSLGVDMRGIVDVALPPAASFPPISLSIFILLLSLSQLLKDEQLSLDDLFALSSADLHDLMVRLGLLLEEEEKLGTYLNLLATYYSESLYHCCKIGNHGNAASLGLHGN